MITTPHPAAAGETYLDVQPELRAAVNRFYRRYGGDYDGYECAAVDSFLRSHRGWRQSRGPFRHWLRYRLARDLLKARPEPGPPPVDPDTIPVNPPPRFDLDGFLSELRTADARMVVTLVLSPPNKGGLRTPPHADTRGVRAAVREYLRDLGWSAGRVVRTFAEIRRHL